MPYGKKLAKILKQKGHDCRLLFDTGKVVSGSDITFFLSYEKYAGSEIRKKSRRNIVIHASDLPAGKGMSPATWQILEGKTRIPVTLFEMASGFDTGDYYLKSHFNLDGTELAGEWRKKLGRQVNKMALDFVDEFGRLKAQKQIGKSTFYRRRTVQDSRLDPKKSIASQFDILRVVDNKKYPAFFVFRDQTYIIKIYKRRTNKK